MKKRILALILTFCMLVSALPLTAHAARSTAEIVEAALQLLYYNEGSYGSVNANDNGALSIGKIQWHGNRALNLLKTIVNMDHDQARSILGTDLYNEILNAGDWSRRTVNSSEKSAISALLVTDNGKAAQDALATQDVTNYVVHGQNLGVADDRALVYFADLENQGGAGMSKRVAKAAAANVGSFANVDLQALHDAALADSVAGKYKSRRNRTYEYCSSLDWEPDPPDHADTPNIRWWLSESEFGETAGELKVGNRYYFCYRLYDSVSGKDWDEVSDNNYSVRLTIYNPDGSVLHSNTDYDDDSWISIFYTEPGEYTREVVVEGDFIFTGSQTFTIAEDPKQIHASADSLHLTMGEAESAVVYVWTSGYHNADCFLNWRVSNDNISCSWGDWADGKVPLTVTAYSGGNSTITLSVKEKGSERVLDSITIDVIVDDNEYTIRYDANGGSGAPEDQVKPHGTSVSLSSTIPARFGYNFLGWSTNSSATAAAYQPGDSFSTDADTTLYAVWQSAGTIPSNVTSSSYSVSIPYAYDCRYFVFTPSFTGKVQFESSASGDPQLYLYDASGNQLASDDDDGEGRNFLLTHSVVAGTKYFAKIRHYSGGTGDVNFIVKRAYDIVYHTNGGSGAPDGQVKLHGTDLVLSSTVPTRDGYDFLGWSTNSSAAEANYQPGDSFTVNADTTLYAVWGRESYTVRYDANGGSGAPRSQTKNYGTDLTISSSIPERFGYNFLGWSTNSSATAATYQPGDSFSTDADTTLYAVWQSADSIPSNVTSSSYTASIPYANDCRYFVFTPSFTGKIQFESSASGDPQLYLYDASGNQLASDDDDGEGRNFLLTHSVEAGTQYFAKIRYYSGSTGDVNFTVKRAYDIVYHANGGSRAPGGQVKLHGTDLVLSSTVPTRDGYDFLGWSTNSSAAEATYQPGDSFTVNADTTLYAVWGQEGYTVRYDANGGSGAPDIQTKNPGTDLILAETIPTRFAYNFKGWATSATAGSADYQPGDTFCTDADTTLYAVWEAAQPWSVESHSWEVVYPGVGLYVKIEPENSAMHELWCTGYRTFTNAAGIPAGTIFATRTTLYSAAGDQLAQGVNPGGSEDMLYHPLTAGNVYYAYIELLDTDAIGTIGLLVTGASTIRYDANGGSSAPDPQYCYRSDVTLSTAVPTRSGYSFLGWATSVTAVEAEYQPGDSFYTESDITLYAVWTHERLPSGSCGPNLTWTMASNGVLTISGSGPMTDYGYKSEMPWYSYRDRINSVVIENGVTSIGSFAFYGMDIESIEIPETVTVIGDFVFKNATKLDGVVLPAGLTRLGESAFYACTSLTAIDIPANLYTVQPYTFKNCTALANVTFHEGNLLKISDGAFYNTALTSVELPDCLDILDAYVFKNCSELASVKLSASLTQIREASLYGTAISTITIPEGVTSIKPYAFKNCVNLVSVDMPSTLTVVDEAAFYACTALRSLELPDAVTTIGNYAFRKCAALADVSFGAGMVDIGESSFYGCESLVYLDIPDTVTTIQAYAFKGCINLEVLGFGNGLTTLGDSAFHTCTSLGEVTIPANVIVIGEYCFSGSSGIYAFTFLGNAPTIGSGAFNKITAIAYYPSGNATWTSATMQNYGGQITWTGN